MTDGMKKWVQQAPMFGIGFGVIGLVINQWFDREPLRDWPLVVDLAKWVAVGLLVWLAIGPTTVRRLNEQSNQLE